MGFLGNTFLVLLGKSCWELDKYNPKDLVSLPDFLLFFLLRYCHCLLPACPSKNPNKSTFFTCRFTICCYFLFLHGICRKKRRDGSLWHCLRFRRRNKHDLLVNVYSVYSKLWLILFKRSKYLAADFLSTQLLGPNSAPMLRLIVGTKHRDSLSGVTGIGSFIQREISGETLTEIMENYLPLIILLFVGTAEVILSVELHLWGNQNQEWILKNWKKNNKRDWKNEMPWPTWLTLNLTQMMQAQKIDLKEAKQGSARGSCSLCVEVAVSEQSSFPNILEQFLALSYWNLEEEMKQRREGGQQGRLADFQNLLDISYTTCFLCGYLSVRV